ncbi:MAG: ribosomal protein S12 methylthiotransferase RimO [Bacteroidetes bacterium GWF2_42_66]|nr:MAG: ribosomal protein S12 methylthiotransferase RimO [Bacteroidetes bacterium GWA2_42_15]OFY01053.1 MAG: ribosomal protein S12 methylthiotransferase RimO [Bacteroidetes bacterium GWE2_42_39]OFY41896.1 MAG: ribosomal protein S12 methylthiotransferase RimO [Bacteroidetes bacterium GWF2_42_66]HBL77926.1 30S ribosomal protein S12 methylthiotransferase RimO [Prolixibacteraceae bacterium]HCR90149.1 30S ribosomal protein S12 methylthiotransferase RimO [Prolixibacteraceae bacterium]
MKRGKVNIVTLGCSKNLVDSEMLLNQLDLNGFKVVHDSEKDDANIVILNTCGFIADAKEESVNTILNFVDARKKGKLDKLLVMGCLSARYKEDLTKEIPEVDKFYGKFDFKEIIKDLNATFYEQKMYHRVQTTPAHFAYLKISEGCNRHCSFCAIPQFTGNHKSRSIESLLEEARSLAERGVKELLVIAQDLSYYGIDMYGESKLAELIDKLADIDDLKRIRLHYAYPSKFPMDVLKVMRERENVCNYLDIPLQHISDRMLGMMRRKITKNETIELIKKIREEVPGIALRTTFLVGHPGETEEDFEELKAFISEYPFDRMGVFAYSSEDDTYAYKMYKDDIPQEIKDQRADELMAIQQEISASLNQKYIGKTLQALIDRKEGDYFVGRTEYDSPEVDGEVLINKASKLKVGEFYPVKITGADEFDLFGETIYLSST